MLHGGTAVVAAVDRRVVARFVPGAAPSTPVVAEAIAAVRAHCQATGATLPDGAPRGRQRVVVDDGRKLGLGSSAAVAAAAVGVLLEAAGFDVEAESSLIFTLADRAHRASQGGRGSGADVAAAVLGGVIAYSRPGGRRARPCVRWFRPPCHAGGRVDAGTPSATVEHVAAVERLAARDPAVHARRLREIRRAADAFLQGYEAGDARRCWTRSARPTRRSAALGRDADLPIVTPALDAAASAGAGAGRRREALGRRRRRRRRRLFFRS